MLDIRNIVCKNKIFWCTAISFLLVFTLISVSLLARHFSAKGDLQIFSTESHLVLCNASTFHLPASVSNSIGGKSQEDVIDLFDNANKKLVHNDFLTRNMSKCGFYVDCPRWYTVADIENSIIMNNEHMEILQEYVNKKIETAHKRAKQDCNSRSILVTGGWCLITSSGNNNIQILPTIENRKLVGFPIPHFHVPPSKVIVRAIIDLIDSENIQSFNDFGAGVGQYKAAVQRERPRVNWRSFDGAGNIETYTNSFVSWADLTMPISIPTADWAISLEVGEHVPNKFEAMVVRNLHKHNCKGIILSWAILKQGGHSHVNCHSNAYVIDLFHDLGYVEDKVLKRKFRGSKSEGQYGWFLKSLMIFRKIKSTIGCKTSQT